MQAGKPIPSFWNTTNRITEESPDRVKLTTDTTLAVQDGHIVAVIGEDKFNLTADERGNVPIAIDGSCSVTAPGVPNGKIQFNSASNSISINGQCLTGEQLLAMIHSPQCIGSVNPPGTPGNPVNPPGTPGTPVNPPPTPGTPGNPINPPPTPGNPVPINPPPTPGNPVPINPPPTPRNPVPINPPANASIPGTRADWFAAQWD